MAPRSKSRRPARWRMVTSSISSTPIRLWAHQPSRHSIQGRRGDFDPSTGQIIFGGGGVLTGDYNNNGQLDAGDLDLQAARDCRRASDPALFDLNNDGLVNFGDREVWVNDLKNTWIGDANLDLEFNSGDMVQVFVAGKYETGEDAGWEDGDWNGDTKFGSGDMVAAFAAGGYEQGAKPAVSAVPEPSSILLVLIGLAGLMGLARRR